MIRSKVRLRLLKNYLLEKYPNSWVRMTLSIIFDMEGRIEIGLYLLGIFLSSDLKIGRKIYTLKLKFTIFYSFTK